MRYSFIITALSLLSSALAITVTAPSSDSVWDFSTAKTIKFTSGSSDPSVISIILRSKDGSFQTKLADNVKTSEGEYTTQPNPSISNGDDYEIQIIDSGGQLAVSDTFTVKKGASDDGTTSLSSSTSSSTSSTSSSTSSTSTSTSSSSTSTTTSSSSTTTTTTSSSATTTFTSVTPTLTSLVSSTSTSSTDPSSSSASTTSSSDSSSTSASASAVPSTDAASSQLSGPKGAMAVLGAAFALIYV
ncbi:hypothetical protein DTO013E5_6406 [Penicillium roqueforti]|uniref:uncharacterized protein n=1 Tax=Penicillium roqueforti TaxID=5082 RepID=UPI0019095C25|nr:uncharacterized protein LCP9604111_7397 [Penicillium roqueforti]KAF9243963.1 hypothetical protein LCP9604111_7397 [Penicillium roqueforti]KAI2671434.1 hypothetical protein CBS147355_8716 [Penicillium roqueforti]KAI2684783.1 hypothetical protein LCP963914a_4875 [Penicillium roqueforti]KAI2696184.1 hypothetical protein CBS147372_8675 [Penicillium roqueforti]KAI2718367.1 hypothetical protein CBS147318_4944 [Penicillium roqueforti]